MDEPQTTSCAYDLEGGGVLVLYYSQTHDLIQDNLARETDALLRWMGTPKGFTVYLWWRDDPRFIQANEWPSKKSVNGGWTFQHSSSICIYRKEEWDRVLLHETIHALGWDWDMDSQPLPCWGLSQNDTLSPALFEAWTELYAEWLWCGWHNVPWTKQMEWQRGQATQILARRNQMTNWAEDTNVFAYYVLKTALAPHIAFLWVCDTSTDERTNILCTLAEPELQELRKQAETVTPEAISLRMSLKIESHSTHN